MLLEYSARNGKNAAIANPKKRKSPWTCVASLTRGDRIDAR
jgi:hypothetical protein